MTFYSIDPRWRISKSNWVEIGSIDIGARLLPDSIASSTTTVTTKQKQLEYELASCASIKEIIKTTIWQLNLFQREYGGYSFRQ